MHYFLFKNGHYNGIKLFLCVNQVICLGIDELCFVVLNSFLILTVF